MREISIVLLLAVGLLCGIAAAHTPEHGDGGDPEYSKGIDPSGDRLLSPTNYESFCSRSSIHPHDNCHPHGYRIDRCPSVYYTYQYPAGHYYTWYYYPYSYNRYSTGYFYGRYKYSLVIG